jgi:subtilase family serine protease
MTSTQVKRALFTALAGLLLGTPLASCAGRGLTPTATQGFAPLRQSVNPTAISHVVVALPLHDESKLDAFLAAVSDPSSPQYHRFITPEQFAQRYGPRENDLEAVAAEMKRAGFKSVSIGAQAVMADAARSTIARYFGTSLDEARFPTRDGDVVEAVARSPLTLTPLLRSLGARVMGLEGIPPATKFSSQHELPAALDPHNFKGPYGPYATPDFRQAYRFPSVPDLDGHGVTMAVVIDVPVNASDVQYYAQYFIGHSFNLTQIAVDGGGHWSAQAAGEATLDAEQTLGMAPGASELLFHLGSLEFTKIYDGYNAAFKTHKVAVVNSSFDGCEADFASNSGMNLLKMFDSLFKAGLAVGMTWVASSGDQAALGCPQNVFTKFGVEWPASDPYVLAVGGTNLTTSYTQGSNDAIYGSESEFYEPLGGGAYWGSGGGYSKLYARPSWQRGFNPKSGRGVPDVSLQMGGEGFSGYGCSAVRCNANDSSDFEREAGKWFLSIGTSESSPDFVGLIALRVERHGKQGDVHPFLYSHASYFRHGIRGNNGYKTSATKWDPVLGLGTPFGNRVAGTTSVAGTPGSSSNP